MKHGVDPAPCLERNAGRRRRLGVAAGDLHDLGEVAAHVDEARCVGDVGVAEIEVGFVAVGGKRTGPARKKLLDNALPAGLVVFEYIHGHVAARRAVEDKADTAGDLDLHLGERATALGACALSCGNLMVDYQGLELGVADGRLPAALAGLFGKSLLDAGLNSVRLGWCPSPARRCP